MAWKKPVPIQKDGKTVYVPPSQANASVSSGSSGGGSSGSSKSSGGSSSSSSSSQNNQEPTSIAYGSKSKDATPRQIQEAKKTGQDYYIGGKRFSSKPSIAEVGTTSSGTKIYAKDNGNGKVSLYVYLEDYQKQEIQEIKPTTNKKTSNMEEIGTISAEQGISSLKDARVYKQNTGSGKVGYYVNIDDYENVKQNLPAPNIKKTPSMINAELRQQAEKVRMERINAPKQINAASPELAKAAKKENPSNLSRKLTEIWNIGFISLDNGKLNLVSTPSYEQIKERESKLTEKTPALVFGGFGFLNNAKPLFNFGKTGLTAAGRGLQAVGNVAKTHPFLTYTAVGVTLPFVDKGPFDFVTNMFGSKETKDIRKQPYFMETYSNIHENLEQNQKGFLQNILYNTNIWLGTGKEKAIAQESLKTAAKYGLSREETEKLAIQQNIFYNQRAALEAGETIFLAENLANMMGGKSLAKAFGKEALEGGKAVLRKNFFGQFYKKFSFKYVPAATIEALSSTSSQITATENQRRQPFFTGFSLDTINPLAPSKDLASQYVKALEIGVPFGVMLSPLEPALSTKYPKAKWPVRLAMYTSDLGESFGDLATSGISKFKKRVLKQTIEEPQIFIKGKKGIVKATDEILFGTTTKAPKVRVFTPGFNVGTPTQSTQSMMNQVNQNIMNNIPVFDMGITETPQPSIAINPNENIPINPNQDIPINTNLNINTDNNNQVINNILDNPVNTNVNVNTDIFNQAQNVPINVWNPDLPPLLPFALPIGSGFSSVRKGKRKVYINELAMGQQVLNNLLGGTAINMNTFMGKKSTKKGKSTVPNLMNFKNPVFQIIKPINKKKKTQKKKKK